MSKTIQLKAKNESVYPISQVYSTKEIKVGIWKNGKPLYRKCIDMSIPTAKTDGTFVDAYAKVADNIEYGFVEKASFMTDLGIIYTMPYITNSNYVIKVFLNENKMIRMLNSVTTYNGFIATISVLYTKTTD